MDTTLYINRSKDFKTIVSIEVWVIFTMDGVYLLHQPFRRKYSSFLLLNSEIPLRFQPNNSGIFSKMKSYFLAMQTGGAKTRDLHLIHLKIW